MRPQRIRSGSGLGDAIYLRPFADYLARTGKSISVCSNYPDVFIGSGCQVEPFTRDRIDMVAHYVGAKERQDTTIWDDLCAHAKIQTQLHMDWEVRNKALVKGIRSRADGRPIVVVHSGREPMGRRDKFGIELLPDRNAFATVCNAIDAYKVLVGRGEQIYTPPVDEDLWNRTTVADVLDIVSWSSGVVSMCGFPIPMAEAMDKPLLVVWSSKGLCSANPFIRTVTPRKLLTKTTSGVVMDNWPTEALEEDARAFRSSL